jgi:hypothetical protein
MDVAFIGYAITPVCDPQTGIKLHINIKIYEL